MTPEHETELFAKLDLILTRIAALDGNLREIKGRIAGMPTARDFGHLEGQIEQIGQRILDINARLPVPIAYAPPERRAAGPG
ncbi:conserved hypothetical protein [uncultured Gammaproteobacteria bacterium]